MCAHTGEWLDDVQVSKTQCCLEMLNSIRLQVVKIEDELSAIGENQKQLEISEEKARRREEKYQVAILNIFEKGEKEKGKKEEGGEVPGGNVEKL